VIRSHPTVRLPVSATTTAVAATTEATAATVEATAPTAGHSV
jgi:hypothetical protein